MALDSDLGSSFMLKQLEGHLQPNDIVLLVVDYQTSQKGNLLPQLITETISVRGSWIGVLIYPFRTFEWASSLLLVHFVFFKHMGYGPYF